MSNLVVVVFKDMTTAFEMRAALAKMQREYLIEMEDAVVVTKDLNGKAQLHQAMNLTTAGAAGGGFWGLLIGTIFLQAAHRHIGVAYRLDFLNAEIIRGKIEAREQSIQKTNDVVRRHFRCQRGEADQVGESDRDLSEAIGDPLLATA